MQIRISTQNSKDTVNNQDENQSGVATSEPIGSPFSNNQAIQYNFASIMAQEQIVHKLDLNELATSLPQEDLQQKQPLQKQYLLFFQDVHSMLTMMLVMFLLSLPSLYLNISSSGLQVLGETSKQNQLSFLLLTLTPFNLPIPQLISDDPETQNPSDTTQTLNEKIIQQYYTDIAQTRTWLIASDICLALGFIALIIRFKQRRKFKITMKNSMINVSDYAVEITGFPSTLRDSKELEDHFKSFGEIQECCLSKDFKGMLELYQQILNKKIEINDCEENGKINKIKDQLIMNKDVQEDDMNNRIKCQIKDDSKSDEDNCQKFKNNLDKNKQDKSKQQFLRAFSRQDHISDKESQDCHDEEMRKSSKSNNIFAKFTNPLPPPINRIIKINSKQNHNENDIQDKTISSKINHNIFIQNVFNSNKTHDEINCRNTIDSPLAHRQIGEDSLYNSSRWQDSQQGKVIEISKFQEAESSSSEKSTNSTDNNYQHKLEKLKIQCAEMEIITRKRRDKLIGYDYQHTDYPSVSAFMVFTTLSAKNKCLEVYGKQKKSFCLKRCLIRKQQSQQPSQTQSNKLFRDIYQLKVSHKTPEPGNISWENIGQSKIIIQSRFMIVLVFCIGIVMTLRSLAAVFNNSFAQFLESAYSKDGSTLDSQDNSCLTDKVYTISDTQNAAEIQCFCSQYRFDTILCNKQLKIHCMKYLLQATYSPVIALNYAAQTFIIGTFLEIILILLLKLKFFKYKTITEQTNALSLLLFLTLAANLIIALHINAFEHSILSLFGKINSYEHQQNQKQESVFVKSIYDTSDFNRAWHVRVGLNVQHSFIISMFLPHISDLLLTLFKRRRINKAKEELTKKKKKKISIPHRFSPECELYKFQAEILSQVFFGLVYSPAIPLLSLFSLLALIAQHFVYKYILKETSRAQNFEHSSLFSQLLPLSLILRLITSNSIMTFTDRNIFPTQLGSNNLYNLDQARLRDSHLGAADNQSGFGEYLKAVIDRSGEMKFMIAIQLLAGVGFCCFSRFNSVLRSFRMPCLKNKEIVSSEVSQGLSATEQMQKDYTFDMFQKNFRKNNEQLVTTYDISKNPQYNQVLELLNTRVSQNRVIQPLTKAGIKASTFSKKSLFIEVSKEQETLVTTESDDFQHAKNVITPLTLDAQRRFNNIDDQGTSKQQCELVVIDLIHSEEEEEEEQGNSEEQSKEKSNEEETKMEQDKKHEDFIVVDSKSSEEECENRTESSRR